MAAILVPQKLVGIRPAERSKHDTKQYHLPAKTPIIAYRHFKRTKCGRYLLKRQIEYKSVRSLKKREICTDCFWGLKVAELPRRPKQRSSE